MANHKSALKRARQNIKRNARNRALRSALRTQIKAFRSILAKKDTGDQAKNFLPGVCRAVDKAASKGILHRNTAARYKSRLTRALQEHQKALAS